MWHNNVNVTRTFARNGAQRAWARIDGLDGWKRIRPNAPDGVTNVFMILCLARANGRRVNVFIDPSDDRITEAALR